MTILVTPGEWVIQYSKHPLMSAEFGEISTSLHLFSIALLIRASADNRLSVAREWWLLSSLPSTRPPRHLSIELLPCIQAQACSVVRGHFIPQHTAFQKALFGPLLQLACVSLDGTPVLEHSKRSSQLVTWTLGKAGIHRLLHIITERVQSLTDSLAVLHWSPAWRQSLTH